MTPHTLTIEVISPTRQDGSAGLIRLSGDLDLVGEERLRAAISRVLDTRPRALTLELSGLRFIDCTGLSLMIWARNRQARHGGVLRLRNPRPNVRRLLEFAGLDAHLPDARSPAATMWLEPVPTKEP